MSDHSSPFRKAYERVWPDAQFGQCWPHIIGKVRAADGVLIAGPPIDAWLTLVDKGTPESALEMCGYRRKERIRSNPACTADLHTCELCSCECVRVCAVCDEVRARAHRISLSHPPCPSSLVCLGLFGCCAAEAVCNDAASMCFGRACVCHRWVRGGSQSGGHCEPARLRPPL